MSLLLLLLLGMEGGPEIGRGVPTVSSGAGGGRSFCCSLGGGSDWGAKAVTPATGDLLREAAVVALAGDLRSDAVVATAAFPAEGDFSLDLRSTGPGEEISVAGMVAAEAGMVDTE